MQRSRQIGRRAPLGGAGAVALVLLLALLGGSCGRGKAPAERAAAPPVKVLLLGVDAENWTVLCPLMRMGLLPNLERLRAHGASGSLATLEPTLSVAIWTSIITGKAPEQHGILNWEEASGDGPGGQLALTVSYRRAKALWNILSDRGIRSTALNWWVSYPPEKIDGRILSNRFDYDQVEPKTHPPALWNKLKPLLARLRGESVDQLLGGERAQAGLPPAGGPTPTLEGMKQDLIREQLVLQGGRLLLAEEQTPFFCLYTRALDTLQHQLWDTVEPWAFEPRDPRRAAQIEELRWVIPKQQQALDRELGRLMGQCSAETVFFVVSDHAMEPLVGAPPWLMGLRVNAVLEALGYLAFDPKGGIVWPRTRVADNGHYPPSLDRGLCVNVAGRGPKGVVDPGDLSGLEAKVIEELKALRTVEGDEPLFSEVGPGRNSTEDLHLVLNDKIGKGRSIRLSGRPWALDPHVALIIHPQAGQHWYAPPGIFIAAGPGLAAGTKVKGASVYDVAPTILYLLGLPVARDMKGKVLLEILDASQPQRPVMVIDTYESPGAKPQPAESQPEVDKQIRDELKGLGYLS